MKTHLHSKDELSASPGFARTPLLEQLRQSGEYQRIMQPLLDYDWRD
jgi:hypothetical protein